MVVYDLFNKFLHVVQRSAYRLFAGVDDFLNNVSKSTKVSHNVSYFYLDFLQDLALINQFIAGRPTPIFHWQSHLVSWPGQHYQVLDFFSICWRLPPCLGGTVQNVHLKRKQLTLISYIWFEDYTVQETVTFFDVPGNFVLFAVFLTIFTIKYMWHNWKVTREVGEVRSWRCFSYFVSWMLESKLKCT